MNRERPPLQAQEQSHHAHQTEKHVARVGEIDGEELPREQRVLVVMAALVRLGQVGDVPALQGGQRARVDVEQERIGVERDQKAGERENIVRE